MVSYPRGLCVHVCFRSVEVLQKDHGFEKIVLNEYLKQLVHMVISPEIQMFMKRFALDYEELRKYIFKMIMHCLFSAFL